MVSAPGEWPGAMTPLLVTSPSMVPVPPTLLPAGMVMLLLGRLPRTADSVEWEGWRFEVVDLDGKRVDKVLAARLVEPAAQE